MEQNDFSASTGSMSNMKQSKKMMNSIHTVAKYPLFQSQVNNNLPIVLNVARTGHNGAITFRNETYPQSLHIILEPTVSQYHLGNNDLTGNI